MEQSYEELLAFTIVVGKDTALAYSVKPVRTAFAYALDVLSPFKVRESLCHSWVTPNPLETFTGQSRALSESHVNTSHDGFAHKVCQLFHMQT